MISLKIVPVDLRKLNNAVKTKLERMCMVNWLKKLMLFKIMTLVIKLEKSTSTQKLMKLKRKFLTIINILLLTNLIS